MRALIQRVSEAFVTIDGNCYSSIDAGLLVFLGIESADDASDVDWLAKKIVAMRIFPDTLGLMNKSLVDTGGNILIISQFTLHAQTKKGNRPSFIQAALPNVAEPLYTAFVEKCRYLLTSERIRTGVFGADMKVSLINDGPVTIWIDSKQKN